MLGQESSAHGSDGKARLPQPGNQHGDTSCTISTWAVDEQNMSGMSVFCCAFCTNRHEADLAEVKQLLLKCFANSPFLTRLPRSF